MALELAKLSKKFSLKESGEIKRKNLLSETIIHEIFETNSCFHVK